MGITAKKIRIEKKKTSENERNKSFVNAKDNAVCLCIPLQTPCEWINVVFPWKKRSKNGKKSARTLFGKCVKHIEYIDRLENWINFCVACVHTLAKCPLLSSGRFFDLILFVPSENLTLNVPKGKYQFKILIYDEKSLFLHLLCYKKLVSYANRYVAPK